MILQFLTILLEFMILYNLVQIFDECHCYIYINICYTDSEMVITTVKMVI